jgi:predicted Rossmann fold nucleotide-binding protein DprA/Smf involved in DNA uptake
MNSIGNIELLKLPKIAFLCSRQVPANVVLKCYDWAIEQREKGICVISGFHSQIEKDVLHYLLKGKQPVILVLGRAMYKQTPEDFMQPLSENRLLIVSVATEPRQSEQTTDKRNRYIVDISEEIVFGYVNPVGKLNVLHQEIERMNKQVEILSK